MSPRRSRRGGWDSSNDDVAVCAGRGLNVLRYVRRVCWAVVAQSECVVAWTDISTSHISHQATISTLYETTTAVQRVSASNPMLRLGGVFATAWTARWSVSSQ